MPTLYQLAGSAVVRVFPLSIGVTTIGRGSENDIVLVDGEVSREHCRLTLTEGRTLVEDLQSRNGTWLSAAFLHLPTPLASGDRIRIGQTNFVFRDDACPHTITSRTPLPQPAHPIPNEQRRRREEFRFKIRWHFDWRGFAFGWRIRRA